MKTTLTFAVLVLAGSAAVSAEPRQGGRHQDSDRSGGEPAVSSEQHSRGEQRSRVAPARDVDQRGGDFRGTAPRADVQPRNESAPRNAPPPRASNPSRWQTDPNQRNQADRQPGSRHDDRRHDDRRHDDRRYNDRYARNYDGRYDGRHDGRHDNHDRFRDRRGRVWNYQPHWYQSYRSQYFRHDGGRYFGRNRFSIGIYLVPRGYSYRLWRTGEFLPYSYYDRGRYELGDYWRYDLYEPPYWARWVRVGNDALLIDLDTREVIDAVYDLFY